MMTDVMRVMTTRHFRIGCKRGFVFLIHGHCGCGHRIENRNQPEQEHETYVPCIQVQHDGESVELSSASEASFWSAREQLNCNSNFVRDSRNEKSVEGSYHWNKAPFILQS
uniref:Uncharacterized protein n=1 Tax=Cacopsylla melanoneura TaxID=428564 RepID=A0A8D8X235_9HEMI